MTLKRPNLDIDDLVKRYLAGESEQALSLSVGMSRPAIRRRLIAAGVERRGISEANGIRMKRITPSQRQALTAAANTARRTRTDFDCAKSEWAIQRGPAMSASRSRKIGKGETELLDLLVRSGVQPIPQLPVAGYNIDIAVAPVAVEVWWGKAYPFRVPHFHRRTVDLADSGWSTLWVWLGHEMPDALTADAVVSWLEEVRRYPPTIRAKYRVIRRNGDVVATGEAQFDQIAAVPPASHRP